MYATAAKQASWPYRDLASALQGWAAVQPTKVVFSFAEGDEDPVQEITYLQLDARARAIAACLQANAEAGERCLLLYPPGQHYVEAVFGALYSNLIGVPVFPPQARQTMSRLQAIVADAGATAVLTHSSRLSKLRAFAQNDPALASVRWIATDEIAADAGGEWSSSPPPPDSVALIQYTSGSTGTPKGVMLTRNNLSHNSHVIQIAFQSGKESRGVSWLPPYHDMGLIGMILQTVYCGGSNLLMPPIGFVQNPFRWLSAISRTGATISGGPNFAYELCARKITPEQRKDLDLSSWLLAFNGAEPIRHQTIERFADAFAECGFRREAFYPCYGLAEATLLVSASQFGTVPKQCRVDASAFAEGKVVDATADSESRTLVSCGSPRGGQTLTIVSERTGLAVGDNQIGEIWFAGESVARGYWRRETETLETFHATSANIPGSFLRTGDLGFIRDGELFITGRSKELIILRGRNYYPQDIEAVVECSHAAIRPGGCAAFALEQEGEERLALMVELGRNQQSADLDQVVVAIRSELAEHFQISAHSIALTKAGSIPKTTSGKLQRYLCALELQSGSLKPLALFHADVVAQCSPEEISGAADARPLQVTVVEPGARADATRPGSKPSLPKQDHTRRQGDNLILWLRDYGENRLNSQLIDERRCIPPYVVLDFGNRGLMGMEVPQRYGGIELSTLDSMRVMEQLAAIDLTLASFVGVNNVLGVHPILHFATAGMKDRWLPMLAQGRELAGFAITEPGAGSNPRAIESIATRSNEGWRLSGQKSWIGNGAWAGVLNVFVTHPDAAGAEHGMSGFVVAQGTPGLRQGSEALTLGMRGMVQNTIHLENVPVTREHLLGTEGRGYQVARDAMLLGRLGLGAISVGGMKRCAQLMMRYARRRKIATGLLFENGITLLRLSELTAAITATETLVRRLAQLRDAGLAIPVEAFVVCKTSGPEFLWSAADDLVQLLGGRGYTENNIAPQMLRDARLLRIFEGPTEPLLMFLGGSVLHGGHEFSRFLAEVLGAKVISQSLHEAAEEISLKFSKQSSAKAPSPQHHVTAAVGELAMWALLWAVSAETALAQDDGRAKRAAAWAEGKFRHRLREALAGTPAESVLLDSSAVGDLVDSYKDTIGDVEQTLAGEEHGLDELLRRNPVAGTVESNTLDGQAAASHAAARTLPEDLAREAAQTTDGNSLTAHSDLAAMETAQYEQSVARRLQEGLARALKIPREQVDINRSLYGLGMDSLIAVEFKNRIEQQFGVTLPITKFLEGNTLAQLAREISDRLPGLQAPNVAERGLLREPATELPLSEGQKALWFITQLAPANPAYNVALLFRTDKLLDENSLHQALQALANRHGLLRTTFVIRAGEPRQVVQQNAEVFFQSQDLSDLSEVQFKDRISAESQHPFDLSQGPLFRSFLFRRSAQEQVLLLVLHHIIEDSWSLGVLLDELPELYAAFVSGRAPNLDQPAHSYGDYLKWQSEMLTGEEGTRLWSYWKEQLSGHIPILELPTDRPRPCIQSYRGNTHSLDIDGDLAQRLSNLAEAQETTLYVILLAGFYALLHRYTGQDDICIGSPMIGRNRPEWSRVVGYFVNPVVLRANLANDQRFADLTHHVRSVVLQALDHQDFPFPSLVERLRPPRDPGRSPLFDVMFSVQKDLAENLSLISQRGKGVARSLQFGDVQVELVSSDQEFAQFDLSLLITERGEKLEAAFQYNSDLFERESIVRMARHYVNLLRAAAERPDERISRLSLLEVSERSDVLRLSGHTRGAAAPSRLRQSSERNQGMDFSLFYFAANNGRSSSTYDLLMKGAQFADQHGFRAVWTPERHFHEFGGIYPNPCVTGAALAVATRNVRICAGSVVLPLHNPVRVAEDWSVVDNLSHGRVDIAFATGWNARDFLLAPQNHSNRKMVMFENLEVVRQLWRGEAVSMRDAAGGEIAIKLYPSPVQPELPIWIACSGNPETFVQAGACGANVLTSLLLQPLDKLEKNIALYRRARMEHGYDSGYVTLTLHAFLGNDVDSVRSAVRGPFSDYLRTSVELWRHESRNLDQLSERERADLLAYSFERYFQTAALFGTPATCSETVRFVQEAGVDEIACLIDFGVEDRAVLESLPLLNELRRRFQYPIYDPGATDTHRMTDGDTSTCECIHRAFSAAAMQFPNSVAATFEDRQIRYSELERQSNQVAHLLRARNCQPGELVGLLMDRSLEMLVALLGILKSGAAYVPLDPVYPEARLSFMVKDAGLTLIITEDSYAAMATRLGASTLLLDAEARAVQEQSECPLDFGRPEDLAYVIYTSGSTGEPKGVEVTHGSVMNVLTSFASRLNFSSADTLLAVTTVSFDISVLELFLPLIVGAQLVLATRETAAEGALLQQALKRYRPTVMQATPSTWRMLLLCGWNGEAELRILCGGEALPAELAAQLRARASAVWNLYGPTETTIWSTAHRINGDEDEIPIGRPIANTTTYVLDSNLELAPLGVPGELCIGGAGVARGYHNRPELTGVRFIRNSFGKAEERLYRTGDIVRMRPDGSLLFVGRRDSQVKVRGHRIELAEIESRMGAHPAVLGAAVGSFRNGNGTVDPVGYYVSRTGLEITSLEWRTYLRQSLPEYMIPCTYISLTSIPVTCNGKLDRRALPRPDGEHKPRNKSTPDSDLEQTIIEVWKEALGTKHVGSEDNFFDVGGHSLLLTRVQMKLRELLDTDIPMVQLYQYPTVRSLARHLSGNGFPVASQAARRGEARRKWSLAQNETCENRLNSVSRPN